MKKKVVALMSIFIFVLIAVLLTGCSKLNGEWETDGGFANIYEYTGSGEIMQMTWSYSSDSGVIVIKKTKNSDVQKYINLYRNDYSYRTATTSLPSSYKNEAIAFRKIDNSLWIRIMWSNDSDVIFIRVEI